MASCLQKSRILIGLSTTHAVSYVERAGLSETAVAANLHGRSRPLSSARQYRMSREPTRDWVFLWPAVLSLLLLLGLALIAGVHALVGMDVRSGSGEQGIEHRIDGARSGYPSVSRDTWTSL